MTTLVKRTTLIVRDVERSRAFYRDVLGMRTWYDDRITLSGGTLAAGKKGDETHLVIMEASDPLVAKIGLLQFTAPALPAPPRREQLGIGDIVFVMQGDDAEGVHQRALKCGARVYAAPHRGEQRGADGVQLVMTTVSLWDPDDYFIEYNQRHATGS